MFHEYSERLNKHKSPLANQWNVHGMREVMVMF